MVTNINKTISPLILTELTKKKNITRHMTFKIQALA